MLQREVLQREDISEVESPSKKPKDLTNPLSVTFNTEKSDFLNTSKAGWKTARYAVVYFLLMKKRCPVLTKLPLLQHPRSPWQPTLLQHHSSFSFLAQLNPAHSYRAFFLMVIFPVTKIFHIGWEFLRCDSSALQDHERTQRTQCFLCLDIVPNKIQIASLSMLKFKVQIVSLNILHKLSQVIPSFWMLKLYLQG